MTTHTFTTSSTAVYTQCFRPLAQASQEIKTSKKNYKAKPYVKMQTAFETNPLKIQVRCYLINANSYCTTPNWILSFVTNGASHVVGTIIPNLTWKCSSSYTAIALQTAIQTLQEDASTWACKIAQTTDPNDLKALQTGLSEMIKTLKAARKTVFLIYRTYHQNPNAGEETKEVCDAHAKEGIALQYKELDRLIQCFELLHETVFLIYRTYHQNPNAGEETKEVCDVHAKEGIVLQYKELIRSIQCFELLHETIHCDPEPSVKVGAPEAAENNSISTSETSSEEPSADSTPPKKSVKPPEGEHAPVLPNETVADTELDSAFDNTPSILAASTGPSQPLKLRFRTKREASQWFTKQIQICRKSCRVDGFKVYGDLLQQARAAGAPQPWVNFGKTLNAQIKDPIVRYHFFEEFYRRFTEILTKSGLQIQIEKPENFKALLKSLCEAKAPHSVYQALFLALLHDNGMIPYNYNSAYILQAIMNNPCYFPIFDPGHIA